MGEGLLVSARGSLCVDVRGPQATAPPLDVGRLYRGSIQHWVGLGRSHGHWYPGKSTVSTPGRGGGLEEFVCKAGVPGRNLSCKQGWPETSACGKP